MSRLGPEWRGRLTPQGAAALERNLAGYRRAEESGVSIRLQVLPGPGCAPAEAQAAAVYALEDAPALPFTGCVRSPCCACCYTPVIADDLI